MEEPISIENIKELDFIPIETIDLENGINKVIIPNKNFTNLLDRLIYNKVNDNNLFYDGNINTELENINDRSNSEKTDLFQAKLVGFLIILLFVILYSEFIICDIFFGLTDISCARQKVSRMSLDLRTFLLVRGFLLLGYMCELFITIPLISKKTLVYFGCFQISIFILITLFLTVWNIVGSVLFWGYMDRSQCSNGIYDYTFASLIIMLISNFCSINSNSGSKNNK